MQAVASDPGCDEGVLQRPPFECKARAANAARWALFRWGGTAALVAGLIFRRNLDAELMLLRSTGLLSGGPVATPTSAAAWFAVLQSDRLAGLVLLGLFDIVNYLLVGLIFLTLCAALWRVSRVAMTGAALLTLSAIVLYVASNRALTMLALAGQYAAATGAQRALLLGAGEAALAVHRTVTYGSSLYPSFLLISIAGLVISVAMARSATFGKRAAWTGIVANLLGLGYYGALVVAPSLVALPLSVSAVFLLAWYVLVGCKLLTLGRT